MSTSGLSQILPSGGPLADSMSKNRKEKKGGEETGEHDTGMDYKHKKLTYMVWRKKKKKKNDDNQGSQHCTTKEQNHSTQDSRVVPHRGTNWAVLWLTLQIGRDAVLSESYGRGCMLCVG